jgi:hypothetical protein
MNPTEKEADELRTKIMDLLMPRLGPESNQLAPHDVIFLLSELQAFFLSLNCPSCRKKLARELKRRVPEVLEEANSIAALFADADRPEFHVH